MRKKFAPPFEKNAVLLPKAKKQDKARVKKMGGGMMGRRMGYSEGTLKPVDPKKQKGLSKLPKEVRNKMGYMKKGGRA